MAVSVTAPGEARSASIGAARSSGAALDALARGSCDPSQLPSQSSEQSPSKRRLKNETLRILLVSLCLGCVSVSCYVSLQRVTAGLSTPVLLFRHPQWLSCLNTRPETLGAPAAPRNSFGSPTPGEAAYFSSLNNRTIPSQGKATCCS
jgi:hypothetical protein